MAGFDMQGYNTVPERIAEFFAKYPDGVLQAQDPSNPFRVETVGNKTFIVYTAAAYRTPDDPKPGIGTAWEPFPGPTQFTRDSELQNAETSAWGRAIIAVGAASAQKGIATAEDIRNRNAPPLPPEPTYDLTDEITIVDEAGAPRFSDKEKEAIKAEWKKRRFGFKLSEVPESRVQEIKVFLASFEGTDVPQAPEGNAQERSDGGAAAADLSLDQPQAKQRLLDLLTESLGDEVIAKTERDRIWKASGYESHSILGAEEWSILQTMAQRAIDDMMKPSEVTEVPA